jgi:hypothetical protein
MTPDHPPPLRVYHPDAEPYSEWSKKKTQMREQLHALWQLELDSRVEAELGREDGVVESGAARLRSQTCEC